MPAAHIAFAVLAGLVGLLGLGFLLLTLEMVSLRNEIAVTKRKLDLARLKSTDLCPKRPDEL